MGALQPKPDARLRMRLLLGLDAPEGSYHKIYVFATVMITKVFGPLQVVDLCEVFGRAD